MRLPGGFTRIVTLLTKLGSSVGAWRDFREKCNEALSFQLGDASDRARESFDCLRHLTNQAVVFQRKMQELTGTADAAVIQAGLPPIQIQTPTHASILETLNLVNGIFFIHLR